MKNRHVYLGDSRLSMITAGCAALILFFECCSVNIMGGRFMFSFRFPLHIAAGTSFFDMVESAVLVCIPLSMLIFTLIYARNEKNKKNSKVENNETSAKSAKNAKSAKKQIRTMVWPIVFYVMSILVKTAYICLYSGYFTLADTWFNWVSSLLLLFAFVLTVYGSMKNTWLVAVCVALSLMEIVRFFLPEGPFAFVIGTSVYLSTFLTSFLFYIGYAVLGLTMKGDVAGNGKKQ